jgi:hypothetical protein
MLGVKQLKTGFLWPLVFVAKGFALAIGTLRIRKARTAGYNLLHWTKEHADESNCGGAD